MTYDLVEIAWKSVITSGLALLLLVGLRNRSAAERSWIAHAGLVATLLLPLAVFAMPRWQVEAPASLPDMLVQSEAAVAAAALPEAVSKTDSAPIAAVAASFDFEMLALWMYALPAILLLLVTLLAVTRLFALRSRASVMVEQNWLSALAHAQRRMGFKHGTALLMSRELTSPVSWGILRPVILLNEEAVNSASEAEAIIAHELAHVARLDWAKLLIARAATALFWFNPLVWLLARQCHQLREEAADDAVLRSDVVSTDYAALLVGAARHESKGLLLAANGVAPGPGSLKRRVTRVLNGSLSRNPARAAWASACSVGAILISAPLSALAPVPPLPGAIAPVLPKAPAPIRAEFPAMLDASLPAGPPAAIIPPAPAAEVGSSPAVPSLPPVAEAPPPAPAPAPAMAPQQSNGRTLSPEILIKMATHGVTPEYISSLAAADPSLSNLTPDELVKMRIHGVTGDKIRGLAALGYANLGAAQLKKMSIFEVSPEYIRNLASAGYSGLSAEQLVKMRIHGVTPDYIRQFRDAGYKDLTVEELTKMRIHGVAPPADP